MGKLTATAAMRAVLEDRQAQAARVEAERAERLARAAEKQRQIQERRSADPATWGVNGEQLELESAGDVQALNHVEARVGRRDVFDLMLDRGRLSAGQHIAARQLIEDWATMLGVGGRPDDGAQAGAHNDNGSAELVSDRMLRAGDQVHLALGAVGPACRSILEALVEPLVRVGVAADWRADVERVTGEADKARQGALVWLAVENLRQVYWAIELGRLRLPRRQDAA
jgi:hypothetical protein